MKYQVTLYEKSTMRYIVDADSDDEAEDKAMDMDADQGILIEGSVEIVETEVLDECGNGQRNKDGSDV